MGLFTIFKEYKNLEEEQKKFIQEKTLQDSRKLKVWYEFLKKLEKFDLQTNKTYKTFFTFLLIFGIIGFIMLFIFPVVSLPLLILAGISFYYYKKAKKIDIDDSVHKFLLKVIEIFIQESDEKTRMRLEIDLNNTEQQKFLVETIPGQAYGRILKRTDYIYRKPFYKGKTFLLDGTGIAFEIEQKLIRSERRQRSYSGKIKFKTKYKKTFYIEVKLYFPKDKYEIISPEVFFTEDENNYILIEKEKYKKTASMQGFDFISIEEFMFVVMRGFSKVEPKAA